MAEILKGAPVTAALTAAAAADAAALKARGVIPTLAILRVGEQPDDLSYEHGAEKRCREAGIAVRKVVLPGDADQARLMAALEALNTDGGIHGILVFLPLPAHLDGEAVRRVLAPEKDVDGITDLSLAGVFTGSGTGYAPCTAQACLEILDHYGVALRGKRAVVIGRSLVVGRPAAMLLLHRHATVTLCHTHTVDMPSVVREADIVIAAAGRMGIITGDYFTPGQVVVDVGIHWNDEAQKLCGDVCFTEVEPLVSAITPVPGGVGGVTTAVLVSHVVDAARKSLGTR